MRLHAIWDRAAPLGCNLHVFALIMLMMLQGLPPLPPPPPALPPPPGGRQGGGSVVFTNMIRRLENLYVVSIYNLLWCSIN